jgi:hypothetical protein
MACLTWNYLFDELCTSFRVKNKIDNTKLRFGDRTSHRHQAILLNVQLKTTELDPTGKESYWPGSCEWLYLSDPDEYILTVVST